MGPRQTGHLPRSLGTQLAHTQKCPQGTTTCVAASFQQMTHSPSPVSTRRRVTRNTPQPLPPHIFWHIFEGKNASRVEEILARQFALLVSSGLLHQSARLHLGLVGVQGLVGIDVERLRNASTAHRAAIWQQLRSPTLRRLLVHPRVQVDAVAGSGDEALTTGLVWQFARRQPAGERLQPLLYFHSKGSTPAVTSHDGQCADDWTVMMEYFHIERWREAIRTMAEESTQTAGIDMWPHQPRRNQKGPVWHYSGNFWWARASYVAELPQPLGDRFQVGEDWVLTRLREPSNHTVLHSASIAPYKQGMIHHYLDRYPPEMYRCADVRDPSRPSRLPCRRVDPARCHGLGCATCHGLGCSATP